MILDNLTLAQRHKLAQRFWAKVDVGGPGKCWSWLACKDKRGYGEFWANGRMDPAHRVAFELGVGPIPEGLQVLHRCDNPACCNYDHLYPGTHTDNMADKVAKGRQAHTRGEANGSAKLTEADIPKIKALRVEGLTLQEIADRFGVSNQSISGILSGKSWAWLKE